jgi:hypothetical protein
MSRESDLFSLRHEKYLIAEYGKLCRSAGYDVSQFSGTDCYATATAIMGQVKSRARVITKGSFSETDYLGALKQMSAAELRTMRERIKVRNR